MSTTTFATPRTRAWLSTDLGEDFTLIPTNIEKYGCHIMQVKGTSATPGWSYSIGLYDTCGAPEILTIGLPQRAALTAINAAATLCRNGTNLTLSRHSNLLPNRDCQFLPVAPKWVDHLMGRALWYYEDDPPPTLQLIYPDLQNRFQSDPAFDPRFLQHLLQPNAPLTPKEQTFWTSNNPEGSPFL